MRTIVIDFESYYDSEYSLRKMTPVEYILDPRWETIGVAIKDGDSKTVWMTDDEFIAYLARLRLVSEPIMMISHNALFDMCVLAWRYGFVPTLMVDTLGMARAWLGHKIRSLALASLATYLKIGAKGTTVHKVQGMSLAAIKAAGFYDEYAEYSKGDADLCYALYRHMVDEGFPVQEILVMDMVLRCCVLPRFELDQNLLAEHLNDVVVGKEALMDRVAAQLSVTSDGNGLQSVRDMLMSNEQFAEALRSLGIEPPMKISPTTGNETYAFAKTDSEFLELEEHPDPSVQALVSARLGVKSTIEETRTQRMLAIANLQWPGKRQRLMPMPLRYSGAHTHRLCLVGETSITVLRDNNVVYTQLDDLQSSDLVWDGEYFVGHGGLAYAGIKKVIEHCGIVGTPDHRVWTVEHGYQELATAKARGYDIARGEIPDASRIDPALFKFDPVQDQERADGWKITPRGNAGSSGEPTVGLEKEAGQQPMFRPTWDIVDCGPRNRFCANGRIVHNSGDWKINIQNLPSRTGTSKIRKSLRAPDGHRVVAVDASQIEARVAGWFCGADELVGAFANKEDVYSSFAAATFGYEVAKATHPVERFVGKTGILGLQYGLGWPKFQNTTALQSKAQLGQEVLLTDEEAARVVNTYRRRYHQIPAMWRRLEGLIAAMTSRDCHEVVGPLVFMYQKIRLPNGLFLHYHDLRHENGQWWFTYGGKPKYLYGGKLLENITQALARIIVMDAGVRVRRAMTDTGRGIWLNLQVHDELVYIAPEDYADPLKELVITEMRTPPSWGPDIPLDAEGGTGFSYGECK